MKKTAEIISHFFDPLIIYAILGILAIERSGLTGFALTRMIAVFLLVIIAPPATLLAWAVTHKKVTNWDVSKRKERVKVLAVFLIMNFIDLILVRLFGNFELFNLFMLFTIWFLGFFLVTLFSKISGHMASLTLASVLIIRWYGLVWWPLLSLIPLIGWARIASRSHTLAQVIAGVFYSVIILFLFR